MKLFVTLGLVLAFSAAGGVAGAVAQQPTQLQVPLSTLSSPISRADMPNVHTLGEAIGSLTVLADGQECGKLTLASPGSPATAAATFELGAAGQPAACSKDGAALSFVDGQGNTLYQKLTLKAGTSLQLTNLAPEAPSTGSGPLPPEAGTGVTHLAGEGKATGGVWPWLFSASIALAATALFVRLRSRSR